MTMMISLIVEESRKKHAKLWMALQFTQKKSYSSERMEEVLLCVHLIASAAFEIAYSGVRL
eukprot:m.19295 g.19295  ORF g.19295 m.19295 type:complete len:61 (+) comp6532_c1_seq1:138-320(+)